MSYYATINPATGERVREFERATDTEVEAALTRVTAGYHEWREVSVPERADMLQQLATVWRGSLDDLALILTVEMGKPITQARAEVSLCADIFEYYAKQGPAFLEDEAIPIVSGGTAVVRTEPIGPLMGVMPWNFPYYQVIRFVAPNLMLGNTIALKHSRNCPSSALAISRTFPDAGLPEDVYVNVFADSAQVGRMIADPRIRGVSLTGSERAGSAVAEIAGRHMKKFVLELGGSDPFIVLDATELDSTVAAAVNNRLYNAGQACTASKRFFVLDQVYDRFLAKFTEAMESVKPADPADPSTTLGPLSSPAAADELAQQVDDAVAKGARLLAGGRGAEGAGAAYEPTVLAGVTSEMRVYHEELFGPVAVVHRVGSEEEAIAAANESSFGLGASIFTGDARQGRRVAEHLEAGMVWINGTSKSSPELPFGGAKNSGVGRELGRYGLDEFANKKLIRTVR